MNEKQMWRKESSIADEMRAVGWASDLHLTSGLGQRDWILDFELKTIKCLPEAARLQALRALSLVGFGSRSGPRVHGPAAYHLTRKAPAFLYFPWPCTH